MVGRVFSQADLDHESEVQPILERAWDCTLTHLPQFFHIDWFAEREGHLIAWVEFKQRNVSSTQYETVFLNVDRKYRTMAALSMVAPAFFVVRWSDGVIRYINVADVDDARVTFSGERDRWGIGRHDFENLIEIPIAEMMEI